MKTLTRFTYQADGRLTKKKIETYTDREMKTPLIYNLVLYEY